MRAITHPLAVVSEVVEVMRRGNFTRRIKLAHHDESGVLGNSFNQMTDELTTLVEQVQKSGRRTADHLVLRSANRLGYVPEPREMVYRPSVDAFFHSVVRQWRGEAIGVLLTGMGRAERSG